jgi:Ser/Thr protein kinase RdoA (MazF antagonist)
VSAAGSRPDRSLRRLAHAAPARYGRRPRRLRRLAARVLRVDADDGRAYALRCTPRSDRAFGDVLLELAWTAALRADTDIESPEPVPARGGALVQEAAFPDGGEPHDCLLFRWIPGAGLGQRLTPRKARRLGGALGAAPRARCGRKVAA